MSLSKGISGKGTIGRIALGIVAAVGFAAAGCTDPDPITIQVKSAGVQSVPLAGVRLFFNASNGKLLFDEKTDAFGNYVLSDVEELPEGASVSIAEVEPRLGGARLLQTIHDLKAGGVHTFHVGEPEEIHGTLKISFVPQQGVTHRFMAGKCGTVGDLVSRSATLVIRPECLQSDGKVTVYAEAFENATFVSYAGVLADVDLPKGATVDLVFKPRPATPEEVQLPTAYWTTLERGWILDFVNGPGDISEDTARPVIASIVRKGAEYGVQARSYGTRDRNKWQGVEYRFAGGLVEGEEREEIAYRMQFGGQFVGQSQQIYQGGFATLTREPVARFDLSKELPPLNLQASYDYRGGSDLKISWSAPAQGRFQAAVTMVTWSYPSSSEQFYWASIAPRDFGKAVLPQLPGSMSKFVPGAGAELQQPVVALMDLSWRESFEDFAEFQDPIAILMGDVLEGAGVGATSRFAVTNARGSQIPFAE